MLGRRHRHRDSCLKLDMTTGGGGYRLLTTLPTTSAVSRKSCLRRTRVLSYLRDSHSSRDMRSWSKCEAVARRTSCDGRASRTRDGKAGRWKTSDLEEAEAARRVRRGSPSPSWRLVARRREPNLKRLAGRTKSDERAGEPRMWQEGLRDMPGAFCQTAPDYDDCT